MPRAISLVIRGRGTAQTGMSGAVILDARIGSAAEAAAALGPASTCLAALTAIGTSAGDPGRAGAPALDAKTTALLQVAVSVAIGSSPVCLHWSAGRALAAGATKDEITEVLLAIVPVAGLGRVVSAAPEVATALDYDIDAALEEPDGY